MKRLHIKLLCLIWAVLCVSCHDDNEKAFIDNENVYYAQSDDTTLYVHPFVHEGRQYVVLPSYWDVTKLVMSICDESKTICDGEECAFQRCDEDKMKQINMIKSKLPTIFIRTESGSMDFINANKKNEEPGHIIVVDTLGNIEYDGDLETIHGRGNWTWGQDKKPYSIKLPNKTKMLGLKKAKKFNLLSQPGDPTGLRNWMALSTAKRMGLNENMEFSYTNVYLNGNYAGCYLVTNKVDRKPRHDFLLEINFLVDEDRKHASFQLTHGCSMTIRKPENPTTEQKNYIEKEWQKLNDVLKEGAARNTDLPIDSLIDFDSFVGNYMCQEVYMNMDAGFGSFYLGKDTLGRFYADPLWDMDMIMSSPSSHLFGHDLCHVIYAGAGFSPDSTGYIGVLGHLYKNAAFRNQISSCYFDRMKPIVQELFWGQAWTSICSYLQTDMEINNLRWFDGANFEEQCNQMRNWMEERLSFLDWAWSEEDGDSKCIVTLYKSDSRHPIQYVIQRNTKFSEQLPVFKLVDATDIGYEYTFTGYEIDDVPVDLDTLVVDKDITVMGKWKQTKEPSLYQRFRVWFWNLRHNI